MPISLIQLLDRKTILVGAIDVVLEQTVPYIQRNPRAAELVRQARQLRRQIDARVTAAAASTP